MSLVFEYFVGAGYAAVSVTGRRGRAYSTSGTGNAVLDKGRRGKTASSGGDVTAALVGRRGHALAYDTAFNGAAAYGRRGRTFSASIATPPFAAGFGYGRRGATTVSGSLFEYVAFAGAGRRGRSFASNYSTAILAHGRRGKTYATNVNLFSTGFLIAGQTAGYVYALGGTAFNLYQSTALLSDTLVLSIGMQFNDSANLSARITGGGGRRRQSYVQGISIEDVFRVINRIVLAESITLVDTSVATLNTLLFMVDMLQAADSTLLRRDAISAVAVAVHYRDLLRQGFVTSFHESIVIDAAQNIHIHSLIKLMETIDVHATTAMSAGMLVSAVDALTIADPLSAMRAAMIGLTDSAFIGGHFTFAGLDYTIYAMTTVGAAVSEYQGWKFNSFFVVDGIAYGADDTGVHVLDGPDDNGTPIDASVRVGLSTLGSTLYKAVPDVYIGYTSTGAMGLKVITTDRGVKKENWYALSAIPRSSNAPARFAVSTGLHSVYWGFEITNADGADFELDFISVWRMTLTRRKT